MESNPAAGPGLGRGACCPRVEWTTHGAKQFLSEKSGLRDRTLCIQCTKKSVASPFILPCRRPVACPGWGETGARCPLLLLLPISLLRRPRPSKDLHQQDWALSEGFLFTVWLVFFTDNYVGLWMMFPSTMRLFNQGRQLATGLVSAILTHRWGGLGQVLPLDHSPPGGLCLLTNSQTDSRFCIWGAPDSDHSAFLFYTIKRPLVIWPLASQRSASVHRIIKPLILNYTLLFYWLIEWITNGGT